MDQEKRDEIGFFLLVFVGIIASIIFTWIYSPHQLLCRTNDHCFSGVCVYKTGCDARFGQCRDNCQDILTSYCDCDGNRKIINTACIDEPHAETGFHLVCDES